MHHFVEWSADLLLALWWGWVHWDLLTVDFPFLVLETAPSTIIILESVSIIMPVAIVEGPSSLGEAILGWTPVVPVSIIVLIPDFLLRVPLPDDLWLLVLVLAPLADLWVSLVGLDEVQAFFLGVKDLLVFRVDHLLGLAVVVLVSGLNS